MLLKTILNRIEHYKSFVYGKVKMLEENGELAIEIEVKARANGRAICSGCGRPSPGYDRLPETAIRVRADCGESPFFSCMRCGGLNVRSAASRWSEFRGPMEKAT